MNNQHQELERLKTSGNLPSMPQVLVQLIDACHASEVDLNAVSLIVGKDAPLSAKILQLVNSAFIGSRKQFTDVGQAVIFLGADAIKNLAISVSVQQVFRRVETNGLLSLDRFWYHSFQNALIAQTIAESISFPSPAEAYLAGLLHDIGKLILWMAFPGQYAPLLLKGIRCHEARLAFLEKEKLDIDHCEAGAWLCEQWHLPTILTDAIRYHHHPVEEIAQALTLTKIIALADMISHDDGTSDDVLKAAGQLLHLRPEQTKAIVEKVDTQVGEVAEKLNIRVPVSSQSSMEQEKSSEEVHKEVSLGLISRVRDISQLIGALEQLLKATDVDQVMLAAERSLKILFNEENCLFFLWADNSHTRLEGHTSPENPLADDAGRFHFSIATDGNSLLDQAVRKNCLVHSFCDSPDCSTLPTLLDKQLSHLLKREGFAAIPMVHRKELQGILIIGLQQKGVKSFLGQLTPIHLLVQHAAIALYLEQLRMRRTKELLQEQINAASLVARKVAHEINNPVAILKNYTHILRLKHQEGEDIISELGIIDEELNRIGQLTDQLRDLAVQQAPRPQEPTDMNELLSTILDLYRSLPGHDEAPTIIYTPGEHLPEASVNQDSIRQIMINLLNNAMEATGPRGKIDVKTAAENNRLVITVKDNGPGIDHSQKDEIFTPGFTTKHNGHSGLGLAIIKKLVEDMNGEILCITDNRGTTFSVSLPAHEK